MRDDTMPYHGPRHRAAADAAKALAEAADTVQLIHMLRMYADDIENDDGRAHAPQWIREAAKRIDTLTIALHRIAGHGNITAKKARSIADEAVTNKRQ